MVALAPKQKVPSVEFGAPYAKPFIALVDGLPVRSNTGKVKRFVTESRAMRAAERAAKGQPGVTK